LGHFFFPVFNCCSANYAPETLSDLAAGMLNNSEIRNIKCAERKAVMHIPRVCFSSQIWQQITYQPYLWHCDELLLPQLLLSSIDFLSPNKWISKAVHSSDWNTHLWKRD